MPDLPLAYDPKPPKGDPKSPQIVWLLVAAVLGAMLAIGVSYALRRFYM